MRRLFNVFSNLFALPAIGAALYFKLWDSAALLATLASASFIYHACQTDFFCIFVRHVQGAQDYFLLQVADQVLVYVAITWFTFYALQIPGRVNVAVAFISSLIFYLTYISGTEETDAIVYSVIGAFILGGLVYTLVKRTKLRFGYVTTSLLVGVGAIAVLFFFLDERDDDDDDRYNAFHGVWHMLAFLALLFLILIKYEKKYFILKP